MFDLVRFERFDEFIYDAFLTPIVSPDTPDIDRDERETI
ncbi:hypothetical protein P186_1309 [Pyrobaculum ferrireducens]|uniref:Uncharacterized protein n=1 Tax=Pyrobaculum ferrireducens TaxID=1104324 RepID=G7VDF3_9CREN|nr:hypothetical protein P186_1309 [Pyrobaculum ferrireducens]